MEGYRINMPGSMVQFVRTANDTITNDVTYYASIQLFLLVVLISDDYSCMLMTPHVLHCWHQLSIVVCYAPYHLEGIINVSISLLLHR